MDTTTKTILAMKQSLLFRDFSEECCSSVLEELAAEQKWVGKGEVILHKDDPVARFGLVVEGVVHGITLSIDGNESVSQFCRPNRFFAIEFAAASTNRCPLAYVCKEDALIVLFEFKRLLQSNFDSGLRETILVNMVNLLALRNKKNYERMEILEQNSLRQRILLYLGNMSRRKGADCFIDCKNREEMAAYLSVNRSALSNELRKMKDDKLIDFHKNEFRLLKSP